MTFDGKPLDSGVDFEKWKDQNFPPGSRGRQQFEYLCLIGCDARFLLSFLILAALNARMKGTIYDVFGVSRSALAKLPDRLEKISGELESVNRLFWEYARANFVENLQLPNQLRSAWRQQAIVYQKTPELLRQLAGHLRVANEWLGDNVGPKRFDTFRKSVIELLEYVDTCTKSPHYGEVSELLNHLFSLHGTLKPFVNSLPPRGRTGAKKKKRDTSLKLLTDPDALRALYSRSVEYGFRKGRPKASEPRSA
jgi:hypothetical protein